MSSSVVDIAGVGELDAGHGNERGPAAREGHAVLRDAVARDPGPVAVVAPVGEEHDARRVVAAAVVRRARAPGRGLRCGR